MAGYIGRPDASFFKHPPGTIILYALIAGLAATMVALLAIGSWIAVGTLFRPSMGPEDPLAVPITLLIGSGLAAVALALLSLLGIVTVGAFLVSLAGLIVLFVRRERVGRLCAGAVRSYCAALPGKSIYLAGVPAGALLWLNAIAPPRDGDSMRYHLAHTRQIVQDGGWKPILDYHYALPFGWTFNYLPFELLHLPQAAQLVNALLLVVMLASILAILHERNVSSVWMAVAVALLVHPFVVRTFTSANADGYAIFLVFTLCALLVRADELRPSDASALGFVSWIGAQSRYQLVAVGLAALIAILIFRPANLRWRIKPYVVGAIAGLLLASPFYLANWKTFGNPVWPLAIIVTPTSSYADIVGAAYTHSLSGDLSGWTIWWGLERLFTTPELAPLPFAIIGLLIVSLKSGRAEISRLAVFCVAFLALWVVAQPGLYPRFITLLLPAAAVIGSLRFGVQSAVQVPSDGRYRRYAVALVVAFFTFAFAFTSLDQIRYAATGDLAGYHRFTWFYPVYAWANKALPPGARVLVIVNSGHSYYLERQYRRADPWLSGEVDWRRTATAAALDSVLDKGRFDYVIYDDRDWSQFPSGTSMMTAIHQSIAGGALIPIHSFHVPLYTSRVRRRFEMASVYVLARASRPSLETPLR